MANKIAAEAPMKAAIQPTTEERGPSIEERFVELSARYKWYFLIPLGILVIGVIVLAVMSGRANAQRDAATAALRNARTTAEYASVAAEYPNTFSGRLALVRAGDQLFREGKYAEARAEYTKFLDTKPDALLAIPVRASVAQTYIREKNYTAAVAEYRAIEGDDGRDFALYQARYYTAYCHEQLGQLGEAKTWYQKAAPQPETQQQYYAFMQRAWWQRSQDKLDEVNRRLDQKPLQLEESDSSVPTVPVTAGS